MAEQGDMGDQVEASEILEGLGFPALGGVMLMDLSYRAAQKLHGLTMGLFDFLLDPDSLDF